MSDRLKLLFDEASKLSEEEQEFLAARLEEELADEQRWQKRFAETPHVLEKLAAEAREAHAKGLTKELGDCIE